MAESAPEQPRRRRGRPRAGEADGRTRILAAAAAEFEAKGYEGTSMRGVAAAAGVDSALVHHHFGSKADLFTAVVDVPLRPDRLIAEALVGPRDEIAARLVRAVIVNWDTPEVSRRGGALLRASLGSRVTTPVVAGFFRRELIGAMVRHLDAPDAELRASLAASQIAGLILGRYILRLPELRAASVDTLVDRIAPTIHGYLFGP